MRQLMHNAFIWMITPNEIPKHGFMQTWKRYASVTLYFVEA